MSIDKQSLREAAERAASDSWGYDRDEFNDAITPEVVLALLDELEAAEKRIANLESLTAGMEQDPVYLRPFGDDGETFVACDSDDECAITLYAAPQSPQPVVPDIATVETTYPDVQTNWQDAKMYAECWNACRDAMLHGSEPETDNTNQQFESLGRGDK